MVLRTLDVAAFWGRWKTTPLVKNNMTIISVIMKTQITSLLAIIILGMHMEERKIPMIMVGNIPEQNMATIWMTWDFMRAFLATGLSLKFSLFTCQQQVTLHVWAEVGIPLTCFDKLMHPLAVMRDQPHNTHQQFEGYKVAQDIFGRHNSTDLPGYSNIFSQHC